MKKLQVAGVVAVVIAVSFGAGVLTERLLIEHRLVAEPCSVRTWQPSVGFVNTSLDPRDCLSHGRSRAFDGEWDDFAYGGGFRPAVGGPDQVFDLVADGMAKAQIQWLADNKSRPAEFSGKTYRLRFIGRIAHRQVPVPDGHTDVVILERVVDASLVPRVGQAN